MIDPVISTGWAAYRPTLQQLSATMG